MGVIPQPVHYEEDSGGSKFVLPDTFHIAFNAEALQSTAKYLADVLHTRLSACCAIASPNNSNQTPAIRLAIASCAELQALCSAQEQANEGYELTVQPESGVSISGLTEVGVFYGVQSLLQLLPPTPATTLTVPVVKIVDAPRFQWRGAMLDVGRHYFSMDLVRKFVDMCAMHKLNRFHWHLTEDQGWRLEITAFSRLTEFGAWRGTGKDRYGGFYTQDEVRDIVAYAAERHIMIIPEIELPGHCGAALACFPELSCTGKVTAVPTNWGIHQDVYCAGNEETFTFLETVLAEVAALFPAPYIHIGGDECPKIRWSECSKCRNVITQEGLRDESELQTWFIQRISKYLESHGKKIIGWDEILEGGLAEGATVMSWRGVTGGVIAAKLGHDVIMSPTSHCYFDYRQSSGSNEPGAWYAVLSLETTYSFDPIPRTTKPAMQLAAAASADVAAAAANDASADSPAAAAAGDDSQLEDGAMRVEEGTLDDAPSMETGLTGESGESRGLVPMVEDETSVDQDTSARECPLSFDEEKHVLGAQANLWTEYVSDENTAQYMMLPRLCAFAECVWSPPQCKNWDHFKHRLQSHVKLLEASGFIYRALTPDAAKPEQP